MTQRCFTACLCGLLAVGAVATANATVFFTDGFDYSDGQLTAHNGGANVSGGLWTTHSPTPEQTVTTSVIQVVDGEAILGQPASEDVSRAANASLAPGSTWYYATRFTVEDLREVPGTGSFGDTYFMHFKDSGTFNFRGRLFLTAGISEGNFRLGITSSSSSPTAPAARWATDLTFGVEYTAVVSYQAAANDPASGTDGYASLWVNPVDSSSTSVTDTTPNGNVSSDLTSAMNSLAMRQGTAGPARVLVDVASIGDSFSDVLTAVSGGGPTFSPADFDEDGFVDADDLATWQTGFGVNASGDTNNDTVTDGADFLVWQQEYTGPAPPIAAVPEPATLVVGLVGGLAVSLVGRRRSGR